MLCYLCICACCVTGLALLRLRLIEQNWTVLLHDFQKYQQRVALYRNKLYLCLSSRRVEHLFGRHVNPLNAELNPICHLLVLLGDLRFMGPCIVSIFQYTCISNKMQTLRSLFISGNCSTCFGWYLHPSSVAHSTVSTASGVCYTVTAICRYRGRAETGLSVLWVAYATHSTLKPVPTDSGR
jgi:hypothetical protein